MESKFIDVDLARPFPSQVHAAAGDRAEAVVWLHGRPLGRVGLPRLGTRIYRRGLARSIVHGFAEAILRELVRNGMASPGLESFDVATLLSLPVAETPVEPGQLTVVICTDGWRPESLEGCVAAVMGSGIRPAEVIVVWRRPSARGTTNRQPHIANSDEMPPGLEELRNRWSSVTVPVPVRWIMTPSADFAQARRLAVEATRTPLVAFIDEASRVEVHWAEAVCRTFHNHPNADIVTGSVLPDEATNEAGGLVAAALDRMAWQRQFEFMSRCLRPAESLPRGWLNVVQYGTAANVAYRTDAVRAMGAFNAVAAGEAAGNGDHFDIWLRALDGGRCLVREPAASVRAHGTPTLAAAAAEIRGVAAGVSAALVAAAARRPSRLFAVMMVAQWFLRNALGEVVRSRGAARSLAWVRLRGHITGMVRGFGSLFRPGPRRSRGEQIAAPVMASSVSPFHAGRVSPIELAIPASAAPPEAARPPDVAELLHAARQEPVAELLATWRGRVLGLVSVVNAFRPITLEQVRVAAIESHWETILIRLLGAPTDHAFEIDGSTRADRVVAGEEAAARMLGELLATRAPPTPATGLAGPPDWNISIVIPSRDRPDDLRACLQAVLAQRTDRRVEVIVVDNHPESGLTKPVVAEHPQVRLLEERRPGSAYARNRGLLACRGSIIVCVDDDVVVPEGWLETLLAPFADPEIAVVTGNVLPLELDTAAARLAETCSSLSAGNEPFRVDGEWFRGSPVAIKAWEFGTSANIAVRVAVFGDPDVGLFEESLGPGTPVGAGEDPYFLYRVVKAGYALRYCPEAWVWHRHRRTAAGLRRQVYNYAKSAVGYYYLTGIRHGDERSRKSLFGGLQSYYLRRLLAVARGQIDVPLSMVLAEIAGHLVGPFAILRSEAACRALARDPAHPRTPPALPDRSGIVSQDDREPWAIDREAAVTAPPAGAAVGASAAGSTGQRIPAFTQET